VSIHADLFEWGVDFFTEEPIQIGRIDYTTPRRRCRILVARSSEDVEWRVTWIDGERADSYPGVFVLSDAALSALAAAVVGEPA
jgi:hypothetical protein